MQGLIINNARLEFLRPALERWVDCIDRFNQTLGDGEAPYWHGAQANLGLLSAAAWQAELVTLQQHQSKKQRDDGDREGRCDLYIANREEAAYLQASQRWPRIAKLDLNNAWAKPSRLLGKLPRPASLKSLRCSPAPGKPASTPAPKSCRTWSTTCKSITPAPSPGTFPTPTASCTTKPASITPASPCCSSRPDPGNLPRLACLYWQ